MQIARSMSLVALSAALAASSAAAQLARLDHADLAIGRIQTVCLPFDAKARGTHLSWQRTLFDSAYKPTRRRDPDLFVALGCADARRFVDSPFVRTGNRLIQSPMAAAAAREFMEALELRAADSTAAVGLAIFAFDVTERGGFEAFPLLPQRERISRLAYNAVEAGITSPIVLRLCVEFAIDTGDFAIARRCLNSAFALGVDPSWHLVRQALLAFQMNDELAGVASFDLAVAMAHDSAALADVGWRAAWLVDTTVTPAKTMFSAWRALADSDRVEWLHRQVAEHAATSGDGAPYGARLGHAFMMPEFQGAVLQQCPILISVNGAEQAADNTRCRGDMVNAAKRIDLNGQMIRIWNPQSGEPLGVIGYSIERQGLKPDTGGTFDSRRVSIGLNIRQYEWETAAWRDTTLQVTLPLTNDLLRPPLTGVVVVPVFRGNVSWTLAATQPSAFGAISEEGFHVPIVPGHIVASDIVLGVAEQGLSYRLGDDTITLAPQGTVKRKKPLELYFQLRSDSARDGLKKTITLRRIVGGNVTPEAVLTIGERTPLRRGINAFHRELNISSLVGSDFRLDLEVADPTGHVLARRWVNLIVR